MTPDTVLWRQAHPNFMVGEKPTSQVFIPFPKDEGNLSVYDGDQISAQSSYEHYTRVLGNQSESVWAVTKSEVELEGVHVEPAPLDGFPEHSKLDFNTRSQKEWRKIAKRLKNLAIARGCQYRPPKS